MVQQPISTTAFFLVLNLPEGRPPFHLSLSPAADSPVLSVLYPAGGRTAARLERVPMTLQLIARRTFTGLLKHVTLDIDQLFQPGHRSGSGLGPYQDQIVSLSALYFSKSGCCRGSVTQTLAPPLGSCPTSASPADDLQTHSPLPVCSTAG